MATTSAHRERRVIARRDGSDRFAHLHNASKHFVTDNQLIRSGRRIRAHASGLFTIGAADANLQHL